MNVTPDDLALHLGGGDLRSIGDADRIARAAQTNRQLQAQLVDLISSGDHLVAARAADALEKATRDRHATLQPYRRALLDVARTAEWKELRWHCAQLLPRLTLTVDERAECIALVRRWLDDPSAIVRACCLTALVELADDEPSRAAAVATVQAHLTSTSPAVRARCTQIMWSQSMNRRYADLTPRAT